MGRQSCTARAEWASTEFAVSDARRQAPQPVHLLISYSHKDESLREKLGDHLTQLRREGVIADWHDHMIVAGEA